MDISGSKSELSERWRVWLRGFTYFAEGKAIILQNPARKRSELLYRASSGVQDIFENLTVVPLEGQADDVYQQTVRALNAYFHMQENAAYERHTLRQLSQEPGEDVDLFVLRLRKQMRQCGYGVEELEFAVRDQLLEKVSSQELQTKLFEVPNIQLAVALTTARAWETACHQASKIAGGEEKCSMNLVQHRAGKEKPGGQIMHKCYACSRSGHFARDKVCAAKGKVCAKCGKRGHSIRAACCRNEADGQGKLSESDARASGSNVWRFSSATSGRNLKSSGQQINQVDHDSGEEPFTFPINYNGERACEDVIAVKINSIETRMLFDSGAQSTVLGEQQFHNLVESGLRAILIPCLCVPSHSHHK